MKTSMFNRPRASGRCRSLGLSVVLVSMLATLLADAVMAEDEVIEEVVVTGTRLVIQDAIAIKRNATTIVDGLSASDIGDLPALSIGEALETITGAASHRENGGATEISIRGLGPFLGATTFNGRDATNGSGDRSVNFSQFPSELMSKLAIYKTQDASLIEGGVAGLIALETLKPLDYSKRRFQVDVKGNINPDQQDITDATEGDIGYRGTVSYVDQFELAGFGALGLSLGYQNSDTSQPEAEVRSSSPSGSSLYACINDPTVTNEGFFRRSSGDCEDQIGGRSNQGYQTAIDPATGVAVSDGLDFAFAPSSRGYRQNDTSEEREAFFAALQLQPSENWDINLDLEISERVQAERRHDLNFANQKRATAGVTGPTLVKTPSGAILEWQGTTAIESNSELYSRAEDYIGGGLKVEYVAGDRLRLSADLSISETTREELQISLRTQSDNHDIFNVSTPSGYRPEVSWSRNRKGVPQYTITDFDVTDHTLFSDEYRVRIDSDVDRTNKISAFRSDFEFEVGGDVIQSVEGGFRVAELEYLNLGGTRRTSPNLDDSSQAERDAIAQMNAECRNTSFPEDGFLSAVTNGPLVTVIDSATGQPTSGTGSSWATFDTWCMTQAILAYHGIEFAYPDQVRESPRTTDVTETTFAGYVMMNFEGALGGYPVRGNVGVRAVETEVKSVAYRAAYEILTDPDGFLSIRPDADAGLERVSVKDSYLEWLPSLNVVVDLSENTLFRGGIFRGISRADPSDLGYNRSFALNDATDITDPNDLITNVSGSGNPFTKALPSWNYDAAIEWYPTADSILAVGTYYKQFTGGFEQSRTTEAFVVDGQTVNAEFTATDTIDDTSSLYGIEVTASHRFSNGIGFKLSYNWADSDFEFEDSRYGSVTIRDVDGSVFAETAGIIPPGNVPGFSAQTFSGQLYYQIGKFDLQTIYKYRSEYFQPYISNGTRLRYIGDVGVVEARASYRLNKAIKITLEAINILDEPKSQYFFVDNNLGEINSYGPRVFLGVKAKF